MTRFYVNAEFISEKAFVVEAESKEDIVALFSHDPITVSDEILNYLDEGLTESVRELKAIKIEEVSKVEECNDWTPMFRVDADGDLDVVEDY